jgi:NH3-dependent NAD+ synthetase
MNIFFSLNLALTIFFTVSIIILLCCKCGGVLICIAWFFIYIFLLASVALGCALGIASSLVKDASFALKNVMNTIDNINIEKKDILDTCINGNGSLIFTKSIHFNFDSNIIDNIYKLESNISEGINSLQTLTFNSTKANGIHYNTILNKPKSQITELSEALKEIKKYINSEDENSKVDSSTPIYDTWEVNKEDCGEDYYPHQKSLRNLLEENEKKYQCLVITEWTIEEIQERYSAIKSKEEGIIISDIAKQYHNSINNFMKDNKDLINNIIDKNEEFDSSMNNIKESEIGLLNNTREVITPFREIYNKAVDKGSIFGIMNCKFINRDLNKVVETLYKDIGDTFRSTSNIFLGIAGCELLITIFVLIIMKSLRANMTEIPDYSKYSKMVEK